MVGRDRWVFRRSPTASLRRSPDATWSRSWSRCFILTFAPPSLTVKTGTTVTWSNEDDIPHTVASSTRVFKSKALDTDDSFSFTFTEPGRYEYFCSLHPHMTGKIVVEPATHAAN